MRKKGRDKIRFVIDAFTPDTLPMSRLADYLKQFSELIGQEANVYFDKVEKSSAALAAYSDSTATPKIEQRLEDLVVGTAPRIATKSNSVIDDMLLADNAIGYVEINGKGKLLEFPGRRRAPQQKIGPIRRKSVIDGQIFQIGGTDETINVHLRNPSKPIERYRCEANIDLARKLAPYFLLGRVRLFGDADWYRTDSSWTMIPNSFTATNFVPLEDRGLDTTINSAQKIFKDVSVSGDFWDEMRRG